MKAVRKLFFILILPFFSLPAHTLVINFNFDLYLSHLHPPDLSSSTGYAQLVNLIWDQARYLASAYTYGLRFAYYSPSSWKMDKGNFTLIPQALISKGNKSLSVKHVQNLSPSHFKIGIRYVLTHEETKYYRRIQERSITLPSTQGMCEYKADMTFFKEALEDSFYNAIRTYALERNLSQFEGLILLKDNQSLVIKSGYVVQSSQVQLIIEKPASFSV